MQSDAHGLEIERKVSVKIPAPILSRFTAPALTAIDSAGDGLQLRASTSLRRAPTLGFPDFL